MGKQAQGQEQQDARGRDQQQGREHARDAQLVARFEDAVSQPRLGAAGAGDELGDHRADQRQAARDAQAREEIRHRRRQLQVQQRLPPARPVEAEQVDQIVVGRVQPDRGVGQDREEGDDPGADQQRQLDVVDPDDDQRRDRHDRRHLQDHRIGEERRLDPFRAGEQHGQDDAQHHRHRERRQRDAHGDPPRFHQRAPVDDQGLQDHDRAGQQVGRNVERPYHGLPQAERQQAEH